MSNTPENPVQAVAPGQGSQPDFWLHHAHVQLRESVTDLVKGMSEMPPQNLGNLPAIASNLLHLLDDLTKMTAAGFTMQPPPPPVAPPAGRSDNDEMENRVAKLEARVEHLQQNVTEIKSDVKELKAHVRSEFTALRTDITAIRTTDFRILFGAIITVALGLATLMAKGFHWF